MFNVRLISNMDINYPNEPTKHNLPSISLRRSERWTVTYKHTPIMSQLDADGLRLTLVVYTSNPTTEQVC